MSAVGESLETVKPRTSAILANRIVGALAWAGVFVAGVLTYAHLTEKAVPCGISRGCETVAQHESSRWFNIPVAAIGLVGYLLLAVLSIARNRVDKQKWRMLTNISIAGTIFGFFASLYFMYTAVAIIHATCQWCVASAIIMISSLIATAWLWTCDPPETRATNGDTIFATACAILAIGATGTQAMLLENASDVPAPTIGTLTEANILPVSAKIRGDGASTVTIIEFADFNCGGCRAVAVDMDKLYKDGRGKIRWAFRNYPLVGLKGHETSMHAATISELAKEKGLFWTFLDNAFSKDNTERMKSVSGVKTIAMESGLKIADINAALDPSSKAAKSVTEDLDMALRLNIKETPTFLILAKGVQPRAVSGRRLDAVIRSAPYKDMIWGKTD